ASDYGLRKFAHGNNSTFTLYDPTNSPLPSGSLTDVESDPTGGIWVATFEGLAHFNGNTWTVYTQATTGWPGPLVTAVSRRPSDGLIAVATQQGSTFPYTGGVSIFNGTTWTHYPPDNSPLTHWQVVDVEFDGNGNLWASPYSQGVVQIMTGEPAGTPTPTATATATPTTTPTVTPTPTPTATMTPTPTPSGTPTVTPTITPTATPSVTPRPTPTPRGTPPSRVRPTPRPRPGPPR